MTLVTWAALDSSDRDGRNQQETTPLQNAKRRLEIMGNGAAAKVVTELA